MSLYGAVANGVREFRQHQRVETRKAMDLAQPPVQGPETADELLERVIRLDQVKRNLDFANGIAEEILRNLSQIQP